MRLQVLILAVFLAGCAARAQLDVSPPPLGIVEPVHVATSRALMPDGTFGSERSETLSFVSLNIAIPPEREPGALEHRTGRTLDKRKQFFATEEIVHADLAAFRKSMTDELRRESGRDEAIIYVHGFNNTFADGVYRIAQLAHDFEFQGLTVHYSWPSAAKALRYEYDRDSQLVARDGLEELIRTVKAAGATRIMIVAHSMGALLTMETLRQMEIGEKGSVRRLVKAVVFMSPDIDVEVFRSQALRIGQLPDPFVIFTSRRDRALHLSALLTGRRDRLGSIYNPNEVKDLDVTLIDVTDYSTGFGHFTAGTSPALISLLDKAGELDAAFRGEERSKRGLLDGLILTVQNTTELVLTPIKLVQ